MGGSFGKHALRHRSPLLALFALALLLPAPIAFQETQASPAAARNPAKGRIAGLVRADFKVAGASCVQCIRRVSKQLRARPGVLKSDVSIFAPHWAVVIFDSQHTSLEKILKGVTEEKIRFEAIEKTTLSDMPLVVLPRSQASQPAAPGQTKKKNP